MNFSEKPTLEEIRRQKELQNFQYSKYRIKFIAATIAILLSLLIHSVSSENDHEKEIPDQNGLEKAEQLITIEGRETFLAEQYPKADGTS